MKLYLSGAIRGEKASVNADQKKVYFFPRYSGSYRFVTPIKGVSELKLRLSYGESGNQPKFGERDLTLASYGLIGGQQGYGIPGTIGNTTVKPERMNELEYGVDAGFFNDRVRTEATYYDRKITDLLVRPQLAPSTGISATTVNGGEMRSKGYELGLTAVPLQTSKLTWTSRATGSRIRKESPRSPPA